MKPYDNFIIIPSKNDGGEEEQDDSKIIHPQKKAMKNHDLRFHYQVRIFPSITFYRYFMCKKPARHKKPTCIKKLRIRRVVSTKKKDSNQQKTNISPFHTRRKKNTKRKKKEVIRQKHNHNHQSLRVFRREQAFVVWRKEKIESQTVGKSQPTRNFPPCNLNKGSSCEESPSGALEWSFEPYAEFPLNGRCKKRKKKETWSSEKLLLCESVAHTLPRSGVCVFHVFSSHYGKAKKANEKRIVFPSCKFISFSSAGQKSFI